MYPSRDCAVKSQAVDTRFLSKMSIKIPACGFGCLLQAAAMPQFALGRGRG
jgi:hypothetical protein